MPGVDSMRVWSLRLLLRRPDPQGNICKRAQICRWITCEHNEIGIDSFLTVPAFAALKNDAGFVVREARISRQFIPARDTYSNSLLVSYSCAYQTSVPKWIHATKFKIAFQL
jgi:hypothetical protein